jgi:hypothetical protein
MILVTRTTSLNINIFKKITALSIKAFVFEIAGQLLKVQFKNSALNPNKKTR